MGRAISIAALILLASGTLIAMQVVEYKSGIIWPEPPVIDPGLSGGVPSDAIVLFDGKSLEAWENGEKWKIEDGVATSAGGTIASKDKFGDCQLHVEWTAPTEVHGDSQGRGNSGVFLMGLVEIQVLDNYKNPTYADGFASSVYGQYAPYANALRAPGE